MKCDNGYAKRMQKNGAAGAQERSWLALWHRAGTRSTRYLAAPYRDRDRYGGGAQLRARACGGREVYDARSEIGAKEKREEGRKDGTRSANVARE
jgi:hypothetical protein